MLKMRRLSLVFLIAAFQVAVLPSCFSQPLTESSSGMTASGVKRTPTPTPAPAATTEPASAAPAAAAPSAPSAPSDSAPPVPAAAPARAAASRPLALSDDDIKRASAVPPPAPDQLLVLVDGKPAPAGDLVLLVDPLQEVAFEVVPAAADSEGMKIAGPAASDLGKPRKYEIENTLKTVWQMDRGAIVRQADGRTWWQAPQLSDACKIEVSVERLLRFNDGSAIALPTAQQKQQAQARWGAVAIVKVPYDPSGNGIVGGYTVGIYPNPQLPSAPAAVRMHPDTYAAPKSLIPVSPETAGLLVSPHFRLGDFSPASERGKRHFIVIDPRLLAFLEGLCARLDQEGLKGDSVSILRAYVSPYQRQLLAREGVPLVEYTRYQYGDSATIILDADRDGVMDDLNGDGKADIADADRLAEIADAVQQQLKLSGGLGVYAQFEGAKEPSTPCVQVDVRGWRERWRRGGEE